MLAVSKRIDCLAEQISRASPFLPLLVAPDGINTVMLLQRRMLLDRFFETSAFSVPTVSAPKQQVRAQSNAALCARHGRMPERETGIGRASTLGVMGPEGILALQVCLSYV